MIVVTGGSGFIGSCIVSYLNSKKIDDILIVDNIAKTDKWKNIGGGGYFDYIHKNNFIDWIYNSEDAKNIDIIIHMGACCSTTEKDFDYLINNNYNYTKKIWNWCSENNKRMIYASSAATYGDGKKGFNDSLEIINNLEPLNGYGYTKHIFDLWSLKQCKKPKQFVGLKFFNVYGPNEYHKGSMASVIFHSFNQVKQKNKIELFKSYREGYKDGEQKRDFIYVKDILKVIGFFIENQDVNGIFNVGTGLARSYNDLAKSVFNALKVHENINYIDIPQVLVDKYQYYTQADISKLREVGYKEEFYSLEEGVYDYIVNYLDKEDKYM